MLKCSAGLYSSVLAVMLTTLLCWPCWKNYCQECPLLSDQQSCQKVEIDGWVDMKEIDKCLQSMTAGTYNVQCRCKWRKRDQSHNQMLTCKVLWTLLITISSQIYSSCMSQWHWWTVPKARNDRKPQLGCTCHVCCTCHIYSTCHKLYLPRVLLFTSCLFSPPHEA